ncbi:MAG: maltose alpha-D-glucosyltransferase [Anaerolineaceae bacterium]|nr:maltose alpha-D-glucosyltransferase [Anaerolineaceae bacterium]
MNKKAWYQNAVFYELHTRAFYDSNNDGIGDLKGIIQKLNYIKQLGVDCIWLLPIFPSPLKDDGYDISDFYNIHPDIGTLEDFKELVKETHKKGMRVIADMVLNHTSDECDWFRKAESDPESPYHDYYIWSGTNEKFQDARIIFIDTETSNWAWNEKAQKYYWHRFYSSQPDLNYDNPAVRDEIKKILRFWLNIGIDGFRADAVPYLFEREDTNCENLPETHHYIKELRKMMDEEYPECVLLAEANQWPNELRPYFAEGNEFHMAFNFPVMPRIFQAIATGKRDPIIKIMEETPPIPENCQWCTFLRNHDELTLEMVTDEVRQMLWNFYAPEKNMRLNLGIRRRLAPLLDGDVQKIELLYAILFSLPGSPIIYYGDEIGMGDNINLKDRDGVRTPMQWSAKTNAGFSKRLNGKLFLPVIDSKEFSYKKINVAEQENNPNSLLNKVINMIEVRKKYSAFGTQNTTFLKEHNPEVFSIIRENGQEKIYCLHNLSQSKQHLNTGAENLVKILGISGSDDIVKQNQGKITLKPYSFIWLVKN